MKENLLKEIEIPEGVEAEIKDKEVYVKGGEAEAKRRFDFRNINIEKKDNKIILSAKKATKREKRMIGTISAHIKNMLKGLKEKFVYKLEICNVHFPMNVAIQGNEVIIKNFLGESRERKAKILDNVEVTIDGNIITVESHNKEAAGQTAANIEQATRVKNKDRRIFQDGIWLIEKHGKKI